MRGRIRLGGLGIGFGELEICMAGGGIGSLGDEIRLIGAELEAEVYACVCASYCYLLDIILI